MVVFPFSVMAAILFKRELRITKPIIPIAAIVLPLYLLIYQYKKVNAGRNISGNPTIHCVAPLVIHKRTFF
jgi:hypothetical protein